MCSPVLFTAASLPRYEIASLATMFSSRTDVPPRLLIISATLSPFEEQKNADILLLYKWRMERVRENEEKE